MKCNKNEFNRTRHKENSRIIMQYNTAAPAFKENYSNRDNLLIQHS